MAEATGALSDYVRRVRTDPVVVLRDGKPVAALVPLGKEEWEDFVVSTHPKFMEIIERSRASYEAEGGISLERIEREFALKPRAARKARHTERKAR